MGCCLSREDDRFDNTEALLPKGKNGTHKRVEKSVEVDLAKKDGANGSYKSPSAVVAAGDVSKVPAKPQPPKKKPVEDVDLLGLNEKPPTSMDAPVAKAPTPPKPAPPPTAEAPVVKAPTPPKPALPPTAEAPVVKARTPPKPAPPPAAEIPVVKPDSPPKPTETSPPKPAKTSPPKPAQPEETKESPKTSPKKPSEAEDDN
uniref:Uncharacterized protein n=1 Tax=Phytophthora ramorum TaxID=164328 RepID=H3H4I4_PHYRM